MITAKPKRSRTKFLVIIAIVVIVGASVGAFFLIQKNSATQPPGFSLAVYKGTSDQQASWSPISSQDTILNGTRGLNGGDLVVVANASKAFSGFISLSLEAPKGITVQFNPVSIRPGASGVAASQLVLIAKSNVTTARDPFSFNLTGKGGSPAITTEFTFHLRIRSTMLFIAPQTESILNGDKFSVDVATQNAYDIDGFQFSISFDPSIIRATNISYALAFQPEGTCGSASCQGFSPYAPLTAGIDNKTGKVSAASALLGRCGALVDCVNVSGAQTYTFATITFVADFTKHMTSTSLDCKPNTLTANISSSTTCTATITDLFTAQTSLKLTNGLITDALGKQIGEPPFHDVPAALSLIPSSPTAPGGTISFNSTSTSGTFSPTTCTLVVSAANTASCSVTYADTVKTATFPTLGANYSGDPTHASSSNLFELGIIPHN